MEIIFLDLINYLKLILFVMHPQLTEFDCSTYLLQNVKSTRDKKLAPNALPFTYQNLKSCKSHEKNENNNNIRLLDFSFSPTDLAF